MPQENLTWKFFRNGAQSQKVESADEFRRLMSKWIEDSASYATYRAAFLALRYEENPTLLIDEIVEQANEVAQLSLPRQAFPPPNGLTPRLKL